MKLNTASHNNASWSTDTDGFPEHSPTSRQSLYYKGLTLQNIILCFLAVSLCILIWLLIFISNLLWAKKTDGKARKVFKIKTR